MGVEFFEYLNKNLISYQQKSDFIVEIDGKTYELFVPNYDGALFDENFNFVGIPAELVYLETERDRNETDCDYYAYKFGGVWYRLAKGSENSVKLDRLKYLGKAVQTVPTTTFLGVHGQYELLSGSGTYTDWCKKAIFLGVERLGICEKNSLAGALKFQSECKSSGLKPIIGMECSVYDERNDYTFTIKVFAKTTLGWNDLLTINKAINCDNAKYITLEEFRGIIRRNENLLKIYDPKTIDFDKLNRLNLDIDFYQIDPVRYNDDTRDEWYLKNLKKFIHSELIGIPMCDAWYLDEEYSCIRPRLLNIGGITAYDSDDQYFKSNDRLLSDLLELVPEEKQDETLALFAEGLYLLDDLSEGVEFEIEVKNRHLPRYEMKPEEAAIYSDSEDMFWGLIEEGLSEHPELIEKFGEEVVLERIQREVGVIKLGDAIDYFLILRDIVNWVHEKGQLTGVARGSAGGCLCTMLLGITKLNPLEYDLLFERFMNEGRVKVSLPDIDTDVPGEFRPQIKEYLEKRYGCSQVCSVGTYSSLQLRAAIKDMSRLYGLEFQDVNDMMKFFDVDDRKPEDLFKVACSNKRVKRFVLDHPDLINEAMLVMPAPKSQSIHACAMMLFPKEKDMFHWVPIRKVDGDYVSEWEGGEMDSAGFLKEDILGVKQIDKFQDMVALIKEHEGKDLDIFNIPLDDPETYRYFKEGWTEDNFHFGSRGLTGYVQQLQPDNIEDLIAAIALYRPGAMENGFHEAFISRKHGEEEVNYWVGAQPALHKTFGLVIYQENVMELCRTLGGLSMVEADDVRKAMVKKKYEALAKYHVRFTPYYMEHFGVSEEYAEGVWAALDKASEYLFNRSHAAAYAITGYISQWVKVHYPIEYWSVAFKYALDTDYARYVAEINKTGVCQVRPVDINISDTGVVIDFKNKSLYWSIVGIKQVAEAAATQILKERRENGQYWSLEDFITRHKWKGSSVNSRVVRNLILAGAFDSVEGVTSLPQRADLLVKYLASTKNKIKEDDAILSVVDSHSNDDWWWSLLQKQLSGLAFFDYERLYRRFKNQFSGYYEYASVSSCNDVNNKPNNGYVVVAGYIAEMEIKKTKKGDSMCRLTIESNYEFIDVVFFKAEYEVMEPMLACGKGNLIILNGVISYDKKKDINSIRANMETNIITLTL